ncbi:MAG: hypothetical protein WAK48_17130 [Candidatus Acidiferrum sp.]
MRFVTDDRVSVRDLAARALAPVTQMKFAIGCLERWGFIALHPAAGDERLVHVSMHAQVGRELRDGWGSGRGIRAEWIVRSAAKGRKTIKI